MGVRPSGDVTFLFTDIESSTALWDGEPSAMGEAMRVHDEVLQTLIDRHGGWVFSNLGDGVAAAFGGADAALNAALDAQRALSAETWPTTSPLRVRMGIHRGSAQEHDGNYLGATVSRAARVMGLGRGAQILVSLAFRDALSMPAVDFMDCGEHRLKGFADPERIFAVVAPGLDSDPPSGLSRRLRPPRALTSLIGRERELDAVVRAMEASALVTLTGVGGVGKTRLALAVAERVSRSFTEGEFWIELASVAAAGDATAAIAAALGIVPHVDTSLVDQIAEAVSDRRVLLALDNCEHVAPAVQTVVTALLERCPRVGVLATSRERLGVAGERNVVVAPLPTGGLDSPAVALLADRLDDRPEPTQADMEVLVEIAQRVDGLPLALELAAARCRALGPIEVSERLHELGLLADRHRPDLRHRTLDAVFAWSYDTLGDGERRVLERLSVFAGAFTLNGAERVAGTYDTDAAMVDEAVASLFDKSLLQRQGGRFRLLETTRQFASPYLVQSGRDRASHDAHTRYIVDRVEIVHAGLRGPDEAKWVDVLDAEWPDVRAVVRRAFDNDDADVATTLVIHLAFEAFWRRPEAFGWISQAVARYGARPDPHRHELLAAGAIIAFTQLDIARSIELAEAALAANPSPGTALDWLPEAAAAGALFFAGQPEEATQRVELALATGNTDRWSAAQLASSLAIAKLVTDPTDTQAATTAVQLATVADNPSLLAYSAAARAAGMISTAPHTATSQLEDAHRLADSVHNGWLLNAIVLGSLANARAATGRLDDALIAYLDAADRAHQTGWTIHAWTPVWSAAAMLSRLGRHEQAATLLGGCEASGVARFPHQPLPPELTALTEGQGDPHLLELRAIGRTLSLPELMRIGRGEGRNSHTDRSAAR